MLCQRMQIQPQAFFTVKVQAQRGEIAVSDGRIVKVDVQQLLDRLQLVVDRVAMDEEGLRRGFDVAVDIVSVEHLRQVAVVVEIVEKQRDHFGMQQRPKGKGAVLLDEEGGIHMLPAPKGTLVNAVGAGDSMVAGFLAGWEEEHSYEHAFRMGLAAGSASAFSNYLATRDEVAEVLRAGW